MHAVGMTRDSKSLVSFFFFFFVGGGETGEFSRG